MRWAYSTTLLSQHKTETQQRPGHQTWDHCEEQYRSVEDDRSAERRRVSVMWLYTVADRPAACQPCSPTTGSKPGHSDNISSIACTVADNNSGRPGLRSAEHGDLFVPWTRTTRLGSITASVVWNSLPLHLRSPSISCSQFQAGLKTHLFRLQPFTDFSSENYTREWTELNYYTLD